MKTVIKKLSSILFLLIVIYITGHAQTPDPIINYKGKINFLKGQKVFNVIYDYENMILADYENEQSYINKEIIERNKLEAGLGEKWAEEWVAIRELRFQPKFENVFNTVLGKKGIEIGNYTNAPYTIIVKTIRMVPIGSINVKIDLLLPPLITMVSIIDIEILFVPTNNIENVLSKITMKKIYAEDNSGGDIGNGVAYRLQKAYGFCGLFLAKYLKRKKFYKN